MIRTAQPSDEQRLEEYIDTHYMEKLSLARMAAELNMGTTKLCALAKRLTGEGSITAMTARRRIAEAKTLLLDRDLSVAQIAERVGFSDYNYFTKTFKKLVGVTPSQYKKMRRHGGYGNSSGALTAPAAVLSYLISCEPKRALISSIRPQPSLPSGQYPLT